jgi:Uma2 family endonuclease
MEPKANYMSQEEYLDNERQAEFKHEYYQGEVFAMSGASRNHNKLVSNFIVEIGTRLKGKNCNVYPSDLRVHIPSTTLYTYPDVVITCGKEEFLDEQTDTLLNPEILVEVLSPSTEDYDRGRKFGFYRQILSLKQYILISSDRMNIETFIKEGEHWVLYEYRNEKDAVKLPSLDKSVNLVDVYEGVEFK